MSESRGRPPSTRTLALVAAGGAVGSLGRAAIAEALSSEPGAFPWGTWTVNVTGAFLLGLLASLLVAEVITSRWVQPLAAVGLLGAFTTFSTVALDMHGLLVGRHLGVLSAYVVATFAGGLGTAWLGTLVAHRWTRGSLP